MELAICSIFRDEAAYLREWIEFHRLVGVQKFYLYNHLSQDNYGEVLGSYIADGTVELQNWPYDTPCQLTAYDHCLHKKAGTDQQIAFIDIDEFLFSPTYPLVSQALDSLPTHWPAIGVNWVCFGNSGLQTYDNRLVIERFIHRVPPELNQHIKSIVRMNRGPVPLTGHAHSFAVNTYKEDGEAIGLGQAGGNQHSSDILRINHYVSKSMAEFRQRLAKGDVSKAFEPRQPGCPAGYADGFAYWQIQDQEDRTIWKFLPQLKARLHNRRKEDLAWTGS